jgi:flavin-dependent dehydrogenase
VIFDQDITAVQKIDDGYLLKNHKNEVVGKSKYVILSNGFNSTLRSNIGIKVGGGR